MCCNVPARFLHGRQMNSLTWDGAPCLGRGVKAKGLLFSKTIKLPSNKALPKKDHKGSGWLELRLLEPIGDTLGGLG